MARTRRPPARARGAVAPLPHPVRRVAAIAAGLVALSVPLSGWIGARILTDAPRFRPPRPSLRAWFHEAAVGGDGLGPRGDVHLSGEMADLPGTWGLVYDGGMAQVLDPSGWVDAGIDRRVVRPYLPLDGVIPTAATQVDRRRGDRRRGDRRGRGGHRTSRSGVPRRDRRARRREKRHAADAAAAVDRRDEADRRGQDRRHGQVEGPWPVRAAFSSYAFADDPQLLAERIGATWCIDAVPSSLGYLPAWRFTPRPGGNGAGPAHGAGGAPLSGVWVIGVHGRGARRTELFRLVSTAVGAGATCLVTSYRTDPWTRDPALLTTLGQQEWEDVDAAMRLAIEEGAEHIVLAGCSLGGAIVATTVRRSTIADRIAGVILDAPALEWPSILRHVAETRHLPRPIIPLVMRAARARARLDWEALDHVSASAEFRHPILLIHGTEDPTVPVWLSDAFAAARPDLVTYLRVDGAGHVRAWNTDRVRYERAVTGFLQQVAGSRVTTTTAVTAGAGRRTRARRAAAGTPASR